MSEISAIHKGARISAQKARLVVDLIRGKHVENALNILAFTNKKAANLIEKILRSAVANAEHNDGMEVDTLYVSTAYVDQGPVMKRMSPRAKGRGNRILKPTCHITIKVAEL